MEQKTLDRNVRKTVTGLVVSDKADKTRVVYLDRRVPHAKYGKIMKRRTKIYVHDQNNESKTGDLIEAASTRPLSKLKRWRLVRIVKPGVRLDAPVAAQEQKA